VNSPKTMQRDFKSPLFEHKKKHQRKHQPLMIGVASLVIAVALASIIPSIATATRSHPTQESTFTGAKIDKFHQTSLNLPLPTTNSPTTIPDATGKEDFGNRSQPPEQQIPGQQTLEEPGQWHSVKVRHGDSLSTVFDRLGIPAAQLIAVMSSGPDAKQLKKIHPGDELKVFTSPDSNKIRELSYQISVIKRLDISSNGETLRSSIIETPIETRIAHTTGTINSSLFLASMKAGLSDNLTMELANLFGWDIDFALDIREGDQFSLIYEEQYAHGKKLRDGNILAAEFINQDKSYRVVRFTDSNKQSHYFAPDGKSVRKAFLRTPVEFSRISSRFSLHRKHPKLNTIRAHKGVDYAAKRGTPIRATGDGKIIQHGNKGGYGRTVIIQHGSRYSTLYAHLNSYARGLHNGSPVKQGQTIGYVGMSGLATGPHLHYEFRINGVHRNPLTVKLPDAAPLPKKLIDEFNQVATPLLAQLDTLKRTTLASSSL